MYLNPKRGPSQLEITQFSLASCTENVFPFISLFEKFIIIALNSYDFNPSGPLEFEKQAAITLMHAV